MQNKILLFTYVIALSSFFIFNMGCNGSKLSQSDLSSLTTIPVTGKCGTTIDSCTSGTFTDVADDLNDYKWQCDGKNGGATTSCSLPKGSTPGSSTGTGDKSTTFYVGFPSGANMTGHVHASTGFSDTCTISKDTTTNTDLTCIIEAPEGDLYAKDLALEYNIPAGMCAYMEQTPYWFYNYAPGIGPAAISLDITNVYDASGEYQSTSADCVIDGTAVTNCLNGLEASIKSDSLTQDAADFKCVYDYTDPDFPEQPNCCYGNYTQTTRFFKKVGAAAAVADTSKTTTNDKKSWGSIKNCLGGPGREWSDKNTSGFPLSLLHILPAGTTTSTYTVKAPLKTIVGGIGMLIPGSDPFSYVPTTLHVANYYGDAANHTHTGFISATSTTAPFWISPIDDLSGSSVPSSQASYEFRCLTRSFETKHRIRVYVREWDVFQDFINYVDGKGTPFFPDRGSDPEPSASCDGLPLGSVCNDVWDADDFMSLLLAIPSYDTSTTANRPTYFPRIKY